MVQTSFTGPEIVSLMRKHKQTIKGLSFRMGITQRRIRQVRTVGLNDPLVIRDWLEAITGVDPGPLPARFSIRHHTEEAPCGYCGCPLYVGESAYEYRNQVFCSLTCCREAEPVSDKLPARD